MSQIKQLFPLFVNSFRKTRTTAKLRGYIKEKGDIAQQKHPRYTDFPLDCPFFMDYSIRKSRNKKRTK
jgi:hypothetical protein